MYNIYSNKHSWIYISSWMCITMKGRIYRIDVCGHRWQEQAQYDIQIVNVINKGQCNYAQHNNCYDYHSINK